MKTIIFIGEKVISERFEQLKEEMNIKYKQISKALIELVEKINKVLPPINEYDDHERIEVTHWIDGNIERYSWRRWCIRNNRIMISANALYTGVPDIISEAKDEIEELSKKRKYEALHKLAQRFPIFLENILDKAERENKALDETLVKLKTMIQILK